MFSISRQIPPLSPLQLAGQATKEVEMRRFNLERDLASTKGACDQYIAETAKLQNDLRQEKDWEQSEPDRESLARVESVASPIRIVKEGI